MTLPNPTIHSFPDDPTPDDPTHARLRATLGRLTHEMQARFKVLESDQLPFEVDPERGVWRGIDTVIELDLRPYVRHAGSFRTWTLATLTRIAQLGTAVGIGVRIRNLDQHNARDLPPALRYQLDPELQRDEPA